MFVYADQPGALCLGTATPFPSHATRIVTGSFVVGDREYAETAARHVQSPRPIAYAAPCGCAGCVPLWKAAGEPKAPTMRPLPSRDYHTFSAHGVRDFVPTAQPRDIAPRMTRAAYLTAFYADRRFDRAVPDYGFLRLYRSA